MGVDQLVRSSEPKEHRLWGGEEVRRWGIWGQEKMMFSEEILETLHPAFSLGSTKKTAIDNREFYDSLIQKLFLPLSCKSSAAILVKKEK